MFHGSNRIFGVIVLGALALVLSTLAGCAKKSVTAPETQVGIPTEEVAGGHGSAADDGAGDVGPGVDIEEAALAGEEQGEFGASEISEGRTSAPLLPIYFDFDRYNIRGDMVSRMEHNARFLLEHPEVKIQIQGNCDERGTNEYNIALGEKRAKSAKDFFVNMGVAPGRIDTVSFGEERPLDTGHNEEAWAKNRRDDFVIIE